MSVAPASAEDKAMDDAVYKYNETSTKGDIQTKLGDNELLELLRKMHELMQKEVDEKEKSGKKDSGSSTQILISNDFKYW